MKAGITSPFTIQTDVIPTAITGRDMLVQSPTGSGKTLAFGIPLIEQIKVGEMSPRAVVLCPTRELAVQVSQDLAPIARGKNLSVVAVFGGAPIVEQSRRASRAAIVVATPGRLADLLRNYADVSARQGRIDRVNDLEHEADRITHDTTALLHRSFVTPLDRDDIHRLISRMDDVLDLMQDAAESLSLYDVQSVPQDAVELAGLVQNCCERMQSAVALLNNMRNAPAALAICQEIDHAESRADQLMRTAISRLFREEADTRQLIKLKAIYELLEAATDKCQDVANVIESLILENA